MKKFLILAPLVFAVTPAHAHLLWAQTSPQDGQLRLYFGEGRDGITTGVKADVLSKVSAWAPDGKKLAPVLKGGAYCAPLGSTATVVGAHQSWGVLDRREGGRGIFRLEYFAKAATSLDKAGFGAKLPFELYARRNNDEALVTLKRDGKAVPDAEVTIVTPTNEEGTKVQTDVNGQVHFPVTSAGLYALRAVVVDQVPGELDGKKYPQTRAWTTLTFYNGATPKVSPVAVVLAPAAPKGNPNADPKAYALLEAAHNNRQVMPANFAGFEADLIYTDGDTMKTGKIVYRRQGDTKITLDGLSKDDNLWLEDKVMNLIGHRRGGDFAQGDGKNPLTLVQGDVNAFGQLIRLNDGMKSEYRVKDGRVEEVTRTAGGTKFTITVLDTINTDAGKYLANHFVVSYRDEKTGALQEVEGYHDSYAQIDGVWLPTGRVVYEMAEPVSPRVRTIRFRDIKILAPTKVAATPTR
ncbi:hypothetical protein IAD21_05632 [Abditibacteriota bacterium]|nr:hypothetical protein IAD21_05632 [Abditibacteriota bacterium]